MFSFRASAEDRVIVGPLRSQLITQQLRLRMMRASCPDSMGVSFLIGHQFLVVLLPHKARASHNTAVDDLGSVSGVMCGITASNDFCSSSVV